MAQDEPFVKWLSEGKITASYLLEPRYRRAGEIRPSLQALTRRLARIGQSRVSMNRSMASGSLVSGDPNLGEAPIGCPGALWPYEDFPLPV